MQLGAEFRGWATHAVCSEVLEHLDDPEAMLANVRPFLAPGCKLVITVPAGPRSAFDKHIGHRAHFTTTRLERTLRAAGLDVVDLRGAGFPFFNLYRLAVVLRGKKLIEDGADHGQANLPLAARATIRDVLVAVQAEHERVEARLAARRRRHRRLSQGIPWYVTNVRVVRHRRRGLHRKPSGRPPRRARARSPSTTT